ncbi:MAG: hypothetical protein J6T41_02760 [Neisseriaceae bacterium]|nr:hypothetical protein [Neisseriaceae bacterium]
MQSQLVAKNVLLVGMDDKKMAVFRMAFKMHAAVRYSIIEQGADAQLAIVDVDGSDGVQTWHDFKSQYPDMPAIYTSVNEPEFPVHYLPKPVKIEALFPLIKATLRGEGLYNPDQKRIEREKAEAERHRLNLERKLKEKEQGVEHQDQFVVRKFQRKEQLPTANIRKFNAEHGLLGALRVICRQNKDAALVFENKPLLVAFPAIQKILLAVSPDDLKKLCENDNAEISIKYIADNPTWRKNAKVSFESCLWQFSLWTCRGRLVSEILPDTMVRLKGWPNLTRLAHISDSMRLSAFMTQTTANLHILYKILRVELKDLLDFIAATYMVGLLAADPETIQAMMQKFDSKSNSPLSEKVQGNGLQEDGIVVRQKYRAQNTGMLQRLMSRLAVKE